MGTAADDYTAAVTRWKAQNWGSTGTANGKTESQNLAAVIQQPGNTTKATATPYVRQDGVVDYKIGGSVSATNPVNTQVVKTGGDGVITDNKTDTIPTVTPSTTTTVDPAQVLKDEIATQNAAHLKSQLAQLEKNKTNQLAALQKSYDEAVANGQMSVLQAKEAFAKQAEQINQQNYDSAENTNFLANQRGIGNSQQLLGMVAGDTARGNALNNSNMSQRDSTLASIKNRLDLLTTQKASDVNTLNQNYDSSVVQATADSQYNASNQAFQLDLGNYNAARDFNYGQQRDATQQGYTQSNMATQQGYTHDNMAQQQQYTQGNMATQQQYTQANMGLQNKYQTTAQKAEFQQQSDMMKQKAGIDIAQMHEQLGINKEMASFTNELDLMKMAKSFGYDMTKMKSSQEFQHAEAAANDKRQFSNSLALQNARTKAEKESNDNEYQLAVSRELAKYKPGTPEYTIKANQMAEAHAKNQAVIDQKLQSDIFTSTILKDPNLDPTGAFDKPKDVKNYGDVTEYNAKAKAFNAFNDATNGKKPYKPLLEVPEDKNWYDSLLYGITGNKAGLNLKK